MKIRAKHGLVNPLLIPALLLCNAAFGQVTITQNANATTLSQMLAGSGVTISNVTKTCDNNGTATFDNVNSNLGIQQGIVLATGKVQSISQAASSFASTQFTNQGDAQLSTLTVGTIYDKCILEFDIIPQGSVLQFNYVFASEEYPEFVCSQYNDVFGFFISGPNPLGGNYTNKNIATIPNSTTPVCINSVNNGTSGTYNGTTWNSNNCISLTNTGYYIDNLNPVNTNIVYDGMTVVLTAKASVTPCQTYHLKLALADVGDRLYDSGVFLEAYSFTSTPYSTSIHAQVNNPAYTSTYEGCIGGTFTVNISAAQSVPTTVHLNISGTATNGVDYNNIADSIVIPAGQTSASFQVNPVQDNLAENQESVIVSIMNVCSGVPGSTDSLLIKDDSIPTIMVDDSTLCKGQSTVLHASGGVTYAWSPTGSLSSATSPDPTATPLSTTTYTVTATTGTCSATKSVTVHVSNPQINITASPGDTACTGVNTILTSTASGGVPAYTYNWSSSQTTSQISAGTTGSYTVTTTDSYGCTATATKSLYFYTPVITSNTTGINCFGQNNGTIALTVAGSVPPYTYIWNNGSTTSSISGLAAGQYTATVSDGKGCTVVHADTLSGPTSAIQPSTTVTSNVSCYGGNNGAIQLTVTGGTSPYTYDWGNNIHTQNRANLVAGAYHVTITDANGCTATASATITQPASALTGSVTTGNNVSCYGGSNGSLTTTVTGGASPYSYNWGNGITAPNRTGLGAGTYTVTITDASACQATASGTITQPSAALNASAAPTANVKCYNGTDGAINVTVTGGTSPFGFNWGNGIVSQNRTGLAAGNYQVSVTDANGCSTSASATITQPASALSAAINVANNVSCYAGTNGALNTTVTGGTSPYTYNWGGNILTPNRTGLTAGSYQVTVTDANSCTAISSATITQPSAALSITPTVASNVNCFGGTNGAINTATTGGTTPYTYNWGNGITTQNRTGLAAGNYQVVVTDANLCTASATANITQPSSALTATATPTANVSCYAGSNGAINASATGGTSPYAYNWGNNITTQNRTNLQAGNYNLIVTDANGCTATASATITQPAQALAANANPTANVSCYGGNNGAINLTVIGGTTPYNYHWNNNATTQNINGLNAGSYNTVITDANGCTASASASVSQPAAALAFTMQVTSNVKCYGGSTGAITVQATGGTTAYHYNWNDAVTTQNRSNLAVGTYKITVTDANSCSATDSVTITQPAAALAASASPTANVSCYGGSNGAINASASGGTTPYNYNWGNGIQTQNRTGLTAGTYNLTVTDANLCSTTASASITQPAQALAANASVSANVSCYGGNNGAINLTALGGTTPYGFNWSNSATTQNISGLTAGSYNAVVTDANGCSAATSANVTQPASALSLTMQVTANVSCKGGNNGAINVQVSGGTIAYHFSWTDGPTTQNRNNLSAGGYKLIVTDSKGCTTSDSITITQPAAALAASTNITANVSCYAGANGSINANATGGTGPYIYDWGNDIHSQTRDNLAAGNYPVTVTDGNGCSATASGTITQPAAALNATTVVTSNVNCYAGSNGAINLTATGGTTPYTYNWGNGITSQNRTGLTAATYDVIVTDAHQCSATATATITQPSAALNAATNVANNVSCFGGNNGSINLTVGGGTLPYTYNWGNGITTQNRTNLSIGNYNVIVTDSKGCTATAAATITQPSAALAASPAVTSNVSCKSGNDGAIDVTTTGGTSPYHYNWNGGDTTQNRAHLQAGTYTVTVTDFQHCSTTATATITQPANALSANTSIANVSCFGGNNGSINISVNGGTAPYTYNWGNNITTQNRTGLAIGNYQVNITDSHGCVVNASATITQPAAALNATATASPSACNGSNSGSITLNATGGTAPYSYNWGNNITTQNRYSLSPGSYTATVTDNHGCTATASTSISEPDILKDLPNQSNVLCYGGHTGSLSVSTSGGTPPYFYKWDNGSHDTARVGLTAGTYTISITDANACPLTKSYTITQPAALAAATTPNNVLCYGNSSGNINLSVNGGTPPYTYYWNNSSTSQSISNIRAGVYTVVVKDANACSLTSSVTVLQPSSPLSVHANVTAVSCYSGSNGSIITTTTGGSTPYTYTWENNSHSPNRTGVTSGQYQLTVTDHNGCSATLASTVSQPSAALAGNLTPTNVSCYGANNGSINVAPTGGTAPYNYNWGNGITTQNRSNLATGIYTVTITDSKGCNTIASTNITQPTTAVNAVAAGNNVKCYGASTGSINVGVTGGTAPYSYVWNGGQNTQNRFDITAGSYQVTVTDKNGCTAVAGATITQPVSAISTHTTVHNVSCYGGNNGAITLTVFGGVSPYNYKWSSGATTADISQLTAGEYSATVTDKNGCDAPLKLTVTAPDSIALSETHSNPLCHKASDGAINAHATGGTPGYNYNWSNGSSAAMIQGLEAGSYTLTVSDLNGCNARLYAVNLAAPAPLDASTNIIKNACADSKDGAMQSIATGGTAPYNYMWSNHATTENISDLAVGVYTLTITDHNGCTAGATNVIQQNPAVDGTVNPTPLPCQNASESISATPLSGVSPYTYHWSNGATTQTVNGVHPGYYSLTIQDANGCAFDTTFNITNQNSFTVNASGGGTITMGETVTLQATSTGSSNVSYEWTPSFQLSCAQCASTVAQPGQTTTYTVVGTDVTGCVASDTVTVDVIEDHTVFVPHAFSPNADGNNDYFQIFGNLAGVHQFSVKIFNRWGEKVYESEDTDFKWDGTFRGVLQDPAVFVYEMSVSFLDNRGNKIYKGSLTLIR